MLLFGSLGRLLGAKNAPLHPIERGNGSRMVIYQMKRCRDLGARMIIVQCDEMFYKTVLILHYTTVCTKPGVCARARAKKSF